MSSMDLVLSEKYKAFLKCQTPVEFLEGTTAAGKTTVGIFKFMLKVAQSPKKLHILAADDTGTAEKNIINKDLGILDDFGSLVEYNGSGTKDDKIPHILFHTSSGDKTIYVLGYGNKKKWKKALGGQYGCLYIDEINTADIDFVREASMRCDYLMATLNPDDPSLDVYKEYINCSRPLPEWEEDTPQEIKDELKEEPKPGWVHWFFSFDDNAGLPEEKKDQIIRNTPKGTKIYKNKILGLRGKATGLDDVWSNGPKDGKSPVTGIKYPLMSSAIAAGLYHPRCKDSHTTYFEGISTPPEKSRYTKAELNELVRKQEQENRQQYAKRQEKKFGRLADFSLDPENKKKYEQKQNEWKSVANDADSAIMISGARITDIFSEEAENFAEMYYKEVRSFSTDAKKIAENLGKEESDIVKIKAYLFEDESLFDPDLKTYRRFDPDCAIAQSWQRLMTGKDIKQHDRTLIEHELLEMKIKRENPDMEHGKAHELANEKFDYPKEALEYYGYLEKHKKDK